MKKFVPQMQWPREGPKIGGVWGRKGIFATKSRRKSVKCRQNMAFVAVENRKFLVSGGVYTPTHPPLSRPLPTAVMIHTLQELQEHSKINLLLTKGSVFLTS